jgi:hypothetical protein
MPPRHNFFIIYKNDTDEVKRLPLKEGIRQNLHFLLGYIVDSSTTTHQLSRALQINGWRRVNLSDQVLLIRPDIDGNISFADEYFEDDIESDEKIIEQAADITFGLERDLQRALRNNNIEQIEPGLEIIDQGKEKITEAGRVDITAKDKDGIIVVIELKAGTASPDAIAQVLAYMSAIKEIEKKDVRGILVAGDFSQRVILAARAVKNLELKKYSFQFSFETVK